MDVLEASSSFGEEIVTKKEYLQQVNYWKIIQKKILSLYLKPIRVFCFHQVSDVFNPESMWKCDWISTKEFKRRIIEIKDSYEVISLNDAYTHIANDTIRRKKYAVITADDGWDSLNNVLLWLLENQIPITLFLNPLYMDGVHVQSRVAEKFLTYETILHYAERYAPLISFGSHGWSHGDCARMSLDEFIQSVQKAEVALSNMPGKIPFYAFTFGSFRTEQIKILRDLSLIPVMMDGKDNYHESDMIHRVELK